MQGGIAQQGTLQVLVVVVVVGGLLRGGAGTGGPKLMSPSNLELVRTWGGVENSNERGRRRGVGAVHPKLLRLRSKPLARRSTVLAVERGLGAYQTLSSLAPTVTMPLTTWPA
jgi:hypothetical protein